MSSAPPRRARASARPYASRRRALGLIAATALAATTVATAAPSFAATTAHGSSAASSAVVAGDARFEVLSPTLIRTEYAGDAKFLDAGTFNAVGRDGFARTRFTSKVSHGWLTISTDAATLRYKVGSGPFTPDNLTLSLRAGKQDVTATPWASTEAPLCAIGTLCEAESLQLVGVGTAHDHSGATGDGFVAGLQDVGNAVTFRVDAATAGAYDLDLRYANAQGGDGQNTTRTLSVRVDDGAPQVVQLPSTGSWDTWKVATAALDLSAGEHTVTVERTASDSGNVNLDSLAVVTPGTAYPAPGGAAVVVPCAFGDVCQAETGALTGGAKLAHDHNDYAGEGFTAGLEKPGSSDTISVTDVPKAGDYTLQLRYANWAAGAAAVQTRTLAVVTGDRTTAATLPATSSWDTWRTVRVPVHLARGTNDVRVACTDDTTCNVNVDTVAVTTTRSPLLAPHAALGGYRRSIDGVDGSALTNPGLLYQDGWSLLDDTTSAAFDPDTQKVTQRSDHGGKPYQDGYLFAYGQDYAQGLRDLAALTGPSELLPRWAYGVWYSEYYDRTAADFEDTILPKFRSENVPLDSLVVDTDFKSPGTWNGWEMDTSKFPDPKGFFDWAHGEGLHTALNIHPSIDANDPHFAQAQATAKGKLQNGVFDWGDPDQLKAYFDLHDAMGAEGNDLWWLDWCCDSSYSSLAGVTGDAWINLQYANATDKTVGRGFAFSRAYGTLAAGGYGNVTPVSTGPWADKRTTLHFTGDTTSSWATLKYEVGYTGGESAATGMASISHDIGGHTGGVQQPGAEPGSTKLPDDLYARWVQLGAFQPIDRLHSNHSDRLPWQYGTDAKASAEKFLNLREDLVPYTYTLARQATATGLPIVRPLYLQYPDQQEAYAQTDSEYLYGPDVLVAPVTAAGSTATTSVWFPAGSTWTDYFTGKTYQGGTTAQITTGLDTMPVFVRSGGILTTRTDHVSNDVQNPLTQVTVTVAEGADGSSSLYEDDGTSTDPSQSATTSIDYRTTGRNHTVTVGAARGSFDGQVMDRTWTVAFTNATEPRTVRVDGHKLSAHDWSWDAATRTVTVHAGTRSVDHRLTVSYQ
ncbi:TIM-barrel domain-containing protein [Luteimicrobium sp. DT211]|uniref:TIM-barrel domain-containing protein n=1 Tax=Luteimicrobium sp. DT211 TaxID=3393412 RepID=UPI003CF3863A